MDDILDVVNYGDIDKLSYLLQSSRTTDLGLVRDDMGRTPLILASKGGHLACIEKLLESGCYNDIEESDQVGNTSIHYSLTFYHWDCFLRLSQSHCYDTLKNNKKLVLVIEEIQRGQFEQLSQFTVESKIIKDMTKRMKAAFIFLLISHHCPHHLLRALVNGQEDVKLTYHVGMNPIMYATLVGNYEALEELLSYESDLSVCDEMGKSALIYAVEKGCVKSGQLLLNALLNSKKLKLCLDLAIDVSFAIGRNEFLGILLKCLKENFDSNTRICQLLLFAAKEGNLQWLKILLDLGTDASWSNHLGETALMYSVIKDSFDCFEFLLELGVPIDVFDCDGETALIHAVQWKRPKYVARLLELGADINLIDSSNMTAISMACCQNDTQILESIIKSPHILDNLHIENHATAFQLAAKFCNIKALVLLMENGIFSWSWMNDYLEISPEVIARAAVDSKTRPGQFYFSTETMTLLKLAFYYRDEGTVRFLMANLYLSEYDIKYLTRDAAFINNVKRARTSELIVLLNQLISQPWSLQALSLLCISSAFKPSMAETDSTSQRDALIRQLPLPESMLNRLMFKSAVSEVCVDKWRSIGVVTSNENVRKQVDLMSHASPIWRGQLPPTCENGDCHNDAESYRKRFETIRIKRLYSFSLT